MYKKLGILAAVWGASITFWMLVESWSTRPDIALSAYGTWLTPLVLLVVTAAVMALAHALLQDWRWQSVAALMASLPFLLVVGVGELHGIAFLLLVTAQLYAGYAIRGELHARLTIDIQPIGAQQAPCTSACSS